jgi:methionyl-tRNA formyltransferase
MDPLHHGNGSRGHTLSSHLSQGHDETTFSGLRGLHQQGIVETIEIVEQPDGAKQRRSVLTHSAPSDILVKDNSTPDTPQ